MRKVFFIILTSLFVLVACNKNNTFTSEQENALNKLNGNYHAYHNRERIVAVISFTANYLSPHEMKDAKNTSFEAHGECYFTDSYYPIPEKGYIPCYYSYSKKATTMSFYYKNQGEPNNKQLLRSYNLSILNEDVFMLRNGGIILTFEKVK